MTELPPKKEKNVSLCKPRINSQNILLAAGLVSIIIGVFLLVFSFTPVSHTRHFFRPIFTLCLGLILTYKGLTCIKKAWILYAGFFLLAFGIMLLLCDSGLLTVGLRQLWPVGVILSGLLLFPVGLFYYKKIKFAYTVPAFVLTTMGVFFLLFSMDIIKMSFKEFASKWWPLLLIIVGALLVVLFFYNQHFLKKRQMSDSDEGDLL